MACFLSLLLIIIDMLLVYGWDKGSIMGAVVLILRRIVLKCRF